MKVKIEKSWLNELDYIFKKKYFINLINKVKEEYKFYEIYPEGKHIFNAFELCPFNNVKVVILGQDPYHGKNQANGLSFSVNKNINLPDVITSGKDLFIQIINDPKINFISNKTILSKILDFKKINLSSKIDGIICIENADPGYDFLFSKNIKGLITKYGGQNSHMAIRCAELNLPALIGVGEKVYNKILENKYIKIDCNLKKIDFIN